MRSSAAEIQTIDEPLHQHNCTHYSGVTQLAHSASRETKISDISTMSQPPITREQLAALPPEIRALFQAVIDHYERQIAELKGELSALKRRRAILRFPPAPNIRMPSRPRRENTLARNPAANPVIPSTNEP